MKKLLIICALALFALGLKAQGRATTPQEYEFLSKDDVFNTTLPGHRLVASGATIDVHFDFTADRYVQPYELYRDGSSAPCALLLVITADGSRYRVVVPDMNSDQSLWLQYKNQLIGLSDSGAGNLLIATSVALGRYAASH